MKKRVAFTVILALVACLALFAGCSERKILGIRLAPNSFATDYGVDASLSTDGAYVVVNYGEDIQEERVQITAEMIEGFDSSTTGEKTLTVTYKGFSITHDYRVYNAENAARPVVTKARLSLSSYTPPDGDYTEYTVRVTMNDLGGFSAAYFSLSSTGKLGVDAVQTNVTLTSDGTDAACRTSISSDGTTLKTVIFRPDGGTLLNQDGILVKIRITGGAPLAVTLTDATLSDGSKNYYLPSVALNNGN